MADVQHVGLAHDVAKSLHPCPGSCAVYLYRVKRHFVGNPVGFHCSVAIHLDTVDDFIAAIGGSHFHCQWARNAVKVSPLRIGNPVALNGLYSKSIRHVDVVSPPENGKAVTISHIRLIQNFLQIVKVIPLPDIAQLGAGPEVKFHSCLLVPAFSFLGSHIQQLIFHLWEYLQACPHCILGGCGNCRAPYRGIDGLVRRPAAQYIKMGIDIRLGTGFCGVPGFQDAGSAGCAASVIAAILHIYLCFALNGRLFRLEFPLAHCKHLNL